MYTETLLLAFGMAWKYALKMAPSLCLLKEKVTNMTFPEDVSFMTGEELDETGSPHHLEHRYRLQITFILQTHCQIPNAKERIH